MENVDLNYAKEHLAELIESAKRGEDVHILDTDGGAVRLQPVRQPDLAAPRITDTMEPIVPLAEDRKLGHLRGKMTVPARLMEPMSAEELRDWSL